MGRERASNPPKPPETAKTGDVQGGRFTTKSWLVETNRVVWVSLAGCTALVLFSMMAGEESVEGAMSCLTVCRQREQPGLPVVQSRDAPGSTRILSPVTIAAIGALSLLETDAADLPGGRLERRGSLNFEKRPAVAFVSDHKVVYTC